MTTTDGFLGKLDMTAAGCDGRRCCPIGGMTSPKEFVLSLPDFVMPSEGERVRWSRVPCQAAFSTKRPLQGPSDDVGTSRPLPRSSRQVGYSRSLTRRAKATTRRVVASATLLYADRGSDPI